MSADVLIDTNYLIWLVEGHSRSDWLLEVLDDPSSTVTVSAISLSEIAIKASIGKLQASVTRIRQLVREFQLLELDWAGNHAEQLAALPLHHRDPFDRMLISQALAEEMMIASTDAAFAAYEGLRLFRSST